VCSFKRPRPGQRGALFHTDLTLGMSDMCMDRLRSTGVLLLLCWTLIGLCGAGPMPRERGQRTRHARHHERWSQGIRDPSLHGRGAQRIEYPSMSDEGTQRVVYPWGRGQTVHDPSVNDSGASSQIQVNIREDGMGLFEGMWLCPSCRSRYSAYRVWIGGDVKTVICESKVHASTPRC